MWNIYQHMQIKGLQQNQVLADEEARIQGKRQDAEVDDLEDKLGRLTLICEAMWTILSQRFGVTVYDLMQIVHDIDMQDGRLDGRKVSPPTPCASCQAMVAAGVGHCQFCGAEVPNLDPFML